MQPPITGAARRKHGCQDHEPKPRQPARGCGQNHRWICRSACQYGYIGCASLRAIANSSSQRTRVSSCQRLCRDSPRGQANGGLNGESEKAGRKEKGAEEKEADRPAQREAQLGEAQSGGPQARRAGPGGPAPGRDTRRLAVPDGEQALGYCRIFVRQDPDAKPSARCGRAGP